VRRVRGQFAPSSLPVFSSMANSGSCFSGLCVASAAICDQERSLGRRRPISAMNAHAKKADRERCLAAGMDR